MKPVISALALCIAVTLLVGCDNTLDSSSSESEPQSTAAPESSSLPESLSVSQSSSQTSQHSEPDSVPQPDAMADWTAYTYEVGEHVITFKLPPALYVQDPPEGSKQEYLYIGCDPSSGLYQNLRPRNDVAAYFSYEFPEAYRKVSDTEYDVAEVGQSFRYNYATDLQPQTFYYYGQYVVFVSGPDYYLPSVFYDSSTGLCLSFFLDGDPAVAIRLFEQVASTVSAA